MTLLQVRAATPESNADTGFTADFGSADIDNAQPANHPFPSTSSTDVDDIFGGPTTHAILLDDPAEPMSAKAEAEPESSDEERPELPGS